MNPKGNLHTNHRQRMRDKFVTARDSLTDHEILEMLLFHVIPRQNTNPIAHRLLLAFGSLTAVLSAEVEELEKIDGIGKTAAFYLTQLGYLMLRTREEAPPITQDHRAKALGDHLVSLLRGSHTEAVYLLLLDNDGKVLGFEKLTDGALTMATVDPRAIATLSLSRNATQLVLAHNHPAAGLSPSDDDVAVTRYLRRAFSLLGLSLEEHYVITDNRSLSLTEYFVEEKKENPSFG